MKGLWLVGLTFTMVASTASAEEGNPVTPTMESMRAPITPSQLRASELPLDRYESSVTVIRERTDGKEVATFVAEPRLIDRGAVVVFDAISEAKSGSVARWKCVAVRDVAECLGKPLRLTYLPKDERIVLHARVLPRTRELLRIASR